jgi:parvulin-like peptidyl-prolyl isomerase
MVKPFEETAFSLKVGTISAPIHTQFGFHIIKVTEHPQAKTATFEEVKDRLIKSLQDQKAEKTFEEYVQELRKKANVTITEAATPPPPPPGPPPPPPPPKPETGGGQPGK